MKVHKVTLVVVDFEDYGVADLLGSIRGPYRISGHESETTEVEWDDDHPLNKYSTDGLKWFEENK